MLDTNGVNFQHSILLFLQYFATGSHTASCQDYEEYELAECLSEETQIIDLFIHYKLQPNKLSQYTLANRVNSSWYSK